MNLPKILNDTTGIDNTLNLPLLTAYKTLRCIRRTPNQEKKRSTNIKLDEIILMNIINDNALNLHNSLYK